MPVVEEYWSGVLRRLQSEVDVFNELIVHAGERGRENELSFARILTGLVPQRYGIGTGLLIDSSDQYSRQTDIVIYDQADEPAILAQTSQVLFPIENVRVCLEVKTSVGTDEINDAAKKRASVIALNSQGKSKPLYALIGYRGINHPDTITNELCKLSEDSRPDLVCVINIGFVAGRTRLIYTSPDSIPTDYACGVALLQERTEKGERLQGTSVIPEARATSFSYKDVSYPVIRADRRYLVAEPSRALLIFCEILVRNLAMQDNRPTPAISHYLTTVARDLLLLG